LKKAKLVKGTEGISGGFVLAKPAKNIHVSELLKAVDPGRSLFACAEIRQNCTLFGDPPPRWAVAGPCRIHAFMQEAERKLHDFLASKTLSDLVCEYACKAPKVFTVETEGWFQGRNMGRKSGRTAHR
jgi:DNA-binding IscR family transcriptional regulator